MPRCKILVHRINRRWYHHSVQLSTGLDKKEGDSLSDECLCPFLRAEPSGDLDCSALEGWLLTNSMKPTIRTKGALYDVAQVYTEQPLTFDDYTYITEDAKATLALPIWHSKKFLQSHTLHFAAPKILQLLVGCIRSLLSCYSFRQYQRTSRQMEMKQLVSWHHCKIHTFVRRNCGESAGASAPNFHQLASPNFSSDSWVQYSPCW